jgi:excisionase family DNA binding protein
MSAYLSPGAFADELAVNRRTILRAIERGSLPVFRDGRVIRIKRTDADAYIAARSTPARRLRSTA